MGTDWREWVTLHYAIERSPDSETCFTCGESWPCVTYFMFQSVEGELLAAEAKVARVEALLPEWERISGEGKRKGVRLGRRELELLAIADEHRIRELRAALQGEK